MLVLETADSAFGCKLKMNSRGTRHIFRSPEKDDLKPAAQSMATIRERCVSTESRRSRLAILLLSFRWLGSLFDAASSGKQTISERTAVRTICDINPRLSLERVKLEVKVRARSALVVRNFFLRPPIRRLRCATAPTSNAAALAERSLSR